MRKVKNPHDVRFVRNAQKLRHSINRAYRRHVANICVCRITRQAGLSKSAFYDHYYDINDAIRHVEHEIVRDFRHNLRRLVARHSDPKSLYTYFLRFIQHNYEDFDAAVERQNYGLIINLLGELHPYVSQNWPHYQSNTYQQLFYLYAGEATFTIINWIKQTKCNPNTISLCTNQLIRIERTTPHRFRELVTTGYPHATITPEVAKLLSRIDQIS